VLDAAVLELFAGGVLVAFWQPAAIAARTKSAAMSMKFSIMNTFS
jgi:hypothetical protein